MMAARSDAYSQVVATLKVLLPLAALALLSTLFFFSGEVDPSQSIPYAELNVEQLAREQRVTSPYFAGVTDGGVAITLTGTTVIPDQSDADRFVLEDMVARLETPAALTLDARADDARIDNAAGLAELVGDTRLRTSDGMRIETYGLRVDMQSADVESLGRVFAEAPFGTLTANTMVMQRPEADRPHRIVFLGDVKLVYSQRSE